MKKKKVIEIKRWIFEVETFEDGTKDLIRTCEGFSPLELLGLAEYAQREIIQQMKGEIPPAKTIRKYVKEIETKQTGSVSKKEFDAMAEVVKHHIKRIRQLEKKNK